jgi:hypothetical protein
MIWSVLPCTMSWRTQDKAAKDNDVLVRTGTYQYILVCTDTYWYILVHTSIYQYVLVHTTSSMYEFHQRTDQYMPVCTSTYVYIRVHTLPCPFKKVQTDLEPAILCITRPEFTPALWGYRP